MTPKKHLTWLAFQTLLRRHVLGVGGIDDIPWALLDQDYLLYLLEEHRLALAVYPLLKTQMLPDSAFLTQVAACCHDQIKQHLRQQQWTVTLTRQLAHENIPHVFLKGPVLNQQLYGMNAMRTSKDIDVLIAPKDAMRAHQVLMALGLVPDKNSIAAIAQTTDVKTMVIKDFLYFDASQTLQVELHIKTCLSGAGVELKANSIFGQVLLGQCAVPVLMPEDNFLYLCAHAAKHHWQRLQWLTDLAVFYQRIPLNWQQLCALAASQALTRALLANTLLLKTWLGLDLPLVPASFWDRVCVAIHLQFVRQLWRQGAPHPLKTKRTFFAKATFHLVLLLFYFSTWRQKKSYLVATFFNWVH